MPIELFCPRCTKMLSFSDDHAGQYAFCDQCQGRLWVPQVATSDPGSITTTTGPPDNTSEQKDSTETSDNCTPPRLSKSPEHAESRSQQKAPENVATFIASDVAESRIEMGADGQLPELTLSTDASHNQKMVPKGTQNLWGLVLLVCGSLIASTALLMFDGPSSKTNSDIHGLLGRLRDKYIYQPDTQLAPYQIYLRAALLARSQGDTAKEQTYYRKVLHLLRAEHHKHDLDEKGLTGQLIESSDRSLRSDEDLENQLSKILHELNKH